MGADAGVSDHDIGRAHLIERRINDERSVTSTVHACAAVLRAASVCLSDSRSKIHTDPRQRLCVWKRQSQSC